MEAGRRALTPLALRGGKVPPKGPLSRLAAYAGEMSPREREANPLRILQRMTRHLSQIDVYIQRKPSRVEMQDFDRIVDVGRVDG